MAQNLLIIRCVYLANVGGSKMLNFVFWIIIVIVMNFSNNAYALSVDTPDTQTVSSSTQTVKKGLGYVSVTVKWLKRPGEMALVINYYGFLTQEGMVNFYIDVNGEQRNFVTFIKEHENRSQSITILSFHPVQLKDGINRLMRIPDNIMVDALLFRNAPYYAQFGDLNIELKFFCHGRWDGDENGGNYQFSFQSPIDGHNMYHF